MTTTHNDININPTAQLMPKINCQDLDAISDARSKKMRTNARTFAKGGKATLAFTIAFGMNDTTEAARERVDQMCEELGAPEIFAWSG